MRKLIISFYPVESAKVKEFLHFLAHFSIINFWAFVNFVPISENIFENDLMLFQMIFSVE